MPEYYCSVCNVRRVSAPGGVCANCQDPYLKDVLPVQTVSQEPSDGWSDPNDHSRDDSSYDYRGRSKRRILDSSQTQNGETYTRATGQQNIQPIQPDPIVPPIQQTPSQTIQTTSISLPQTEGVVRNIVEGRDHNSFLKRWFQSFSLGTSFPRSDEQMEFQVFTNWSNTNNSQGYAADKVLLLGRVVRGKPIVDNTVRVFGKRDKHNVIHAELVENTTDGTTAEIDPAPISALAVRILTVVVLGLVLMIAIGLYSGISGLFHSIHQADISGATQSISNVLLNLLFAAISGLGAYYFGSKAFRLLFHRGELSTIIIFIVLMFVMLSMFGSFLSAVLGG